MIFLLTNKVHIQDEREGPVPGEKYLMTMCKIWLSPSVAEPLWTGTGDLVLCEKCMRRFPVKVVPPR